MFKFIRKSFERNNNKNQDIYCCPITHRIMQQPVVALDGFTYEREAIEEWFNRGHSTSPTTGLPIEQRLIDNNNKKREIESYLDRHDDLRNNPRRLYVVNAWKAELLYAIQSNQLNRVEACLSKDRRLLSLPIINDTTAFHITCQFGSPELVEFFLTAIHNSDNRIAILNLLNNPQNRPNNFQPIHLTFLLRNYLLGEWSTGQANKIELLLSLGANIDYKDSIGNTLLQNLIIFGSDQNNYYKSQIQWLLAKGANLDAENAEGETPILLASKRNNIEIVMMLFNAKRERGTPYPAAIMIEVTQQLGVIADRQQLHQLLVNTAIEETMNFRGQLFDTFLKETTELIRDHQGITNNAANAGIPLHGCSTRLVPRPRF